MQDQTGMDVECSLLVVYILGHEVINIIQSHLFGSQNVQWTGYCLFISDILRNDNPIPGSTKK